MNYDPFDPETHAHPDEHFAALRDHCPVHYHADRDFYTVARSDDITMILRMPELWSSRFRNGLAYRAPAGQPMLLDADPPTHTWQRRLLQKAWTPRLIGRLERRIEILVDDLLDPIVATGRCEFHDTVAAPLPATMIAELVGVPIEDRDRFRAWSNARVGATGGTPGSERAEEVATRELEEYFRSHIAARRELMTAGQPVPDDYTTMMLTATHDGRRLTDEEAHQVLQLLLIGGIETTTLLLSNLLHRVIVEPELASELRGRPERYEVAVEESLRLDSPTLGLFRTPTRTCTLWGVEIPKDAKTMVLFAAVNRDPDLWDDPDAFKLDRDITALRRHYGFGHGAHLCLGAPLARLEGRVVLRSIVERLPGVRYDREPHRVETMIFRGYDCQQISWNTVACESASDPDLHQGRRSGRPTTATQHPPS
jgi:cytochrome P450